jgi:hypothetical protein
MQGHYDLSLSSSYDLDECNAGRITIDTRLNTKIINIDFIYDSNSSTIAYQLPGMKITKACNLTPSKQLHKGEGYRTLRSTESSVGVARCRPVQHLLF